MGVTNQQSENKDQNMKAFLVVQAFFLAVLGAPAPQDLPDPSEVEIIPAVANEGEEPVVIVVRPASFLPDFGSFSGFPGFGKLPNLPPNFGGFGSDEEILTLGLDEIFDEAGEQPLIPVNNGCGLVCKVFKTLEGQLGVMQKEIDGLKTELHNKEIKEGEYDNHTVTYDEKVLPDGTVLRINKTTIHDTDDNGNGFFFQSSIHHVLHENDDDEQEDDTTAEEDTESIEATTIVIGEGIADETDLSEIENVDPSENEIDQKFPTLDLTNIDTGLLE